MEDVTLDGVEDGVGNATGLDATDEESSGDESEDENDTEGDDTDGVPSALPLTFPEATIRGPSTDWVGPTNCPMLPMTSWRPFRSTLRFTGGWVILKWDQI